MQNAITLLVRSAAASGVPRGVLLGLEASRCSVKIERSAAALDQSGTVDL